ncbi:MAG TPA: thiamine pyrophosphate-dependent enzyme [Methanomassiliicoccales archaeon]|nr:thiamine pyrophosphate-dependent enzyme [Methanomassiliicoccales archaeon]
MPKFTIPREELVCKGHSGCAGCGATLLSRYALKALGPKTVVNVPACCWSVVQGVWPRAMLKVPVIDHPFECTAAVSSGIRAALEIKGVEDVNVVGWAGDGGTVDIGLQALSGAIDRGTDMIYIMYDNEAYMNTGIQRSGATPLYAWTNTTPGGKGGEWNMTPKKRIMEMLLANGLVYGATANVAYPEDLIAKLRKAKQIKGPKFVHALSSCPPGWKIDPSKSVEVARLATLTGMFPLYEVEGGHYALSKDVKNKPVDEYLKVQGRYKHLTVEMVAEIQKRVDEDYAALKWRCEQGRTTAV